jgi:hypothetical protein
MTSRWMSDWKNILFMSQREHLLLQEDLSNFHPLAEELSFGIHNRQASYIMCLWAFPSLVAMLSQLNNLPFCVPLSLLEYLCPIDPQ